MENKFEKLKVWKKSHELVITIYRVSKSFPAEEKFSLTDQLRRAAVSVAANIAEGNLHQSNKELIKFIFISKASLEEVKYYLLLSRDLDYISNEQYRETQILTNDCGKLISGFIKNHAQSAWFFVTPCALLRQVRLGFATKIISLHPRLKVVVFAFL